MARIASLSILTTASGTEYLAEEYGKVIENIQKKGVSNRLKNTNLSGTPTAGTVEAKRFANKASKAYGTARSGHAGEKAKADPITVAINVDKEIITEVEQKDVSLYGVDSFIEKQTKLDESAMIRELERAFFTEAVTAGTKHTMTATTPEEKMEELIQLIETTSNSFVDGVDRDMITLVLKPSVYGKIRTYLDTVSDGGAKGEEVGYYHGVRVESSVYLPSTVTTGVCMANGSIAQPVLPTVSPAQKIPLSNAYAFGIFYSYGTKAVMPDLIQWA